MSLEIVSLRGDDAVWCEELLRALPKWFGIEQAIFNYRKDIETLDTYVVLDSGTRAGFITLKKHNPYSGEIIVIAVDKSRHRSGIGRKMVQHAEALFRDAGVEYLQVKTLGPSRPDENYAATRAFYESVGFRPLEETSLWGDVNPCLFFVKKL